MKAIDRNRTIGLAGFLVIAAAYLAWSSSSALGGLGGDNAIYLLSGQYLSPFGNENSSAESFFRSSQYPPLFPLVLGLTGGSNSFLIAHLVTTLFLIGALFLLYRWLHELRFSTPSAWGIALLVAILPGVYIQSLDILSENLYLFLSLLCMWAGEKARDSDEHWLIMAAAAAAGAMLTRTVGVALVIAFGIYITANRPKYHKHALAIAIVPPLLWHLAAGNATYLGSLVNTYGSHPYTSLYSRLAIQLPALGHGWLSNFSPATSFAISMALGVIGLICLCGLAWRLALLKLDGIYAAIYLGIIVAWPFPGEMPRFVLVILPILLAQGFWLLSQLPRVRLFEGDRNFAPITVLTVLALIAAPQLALNVQRFSQPVPPSLSSFKKTPGWYDADPQNAIIYLHFMGSFTKAMESAQHVVPPGQCVLSIKPSITALYLSRFSKSPPLPDMSDAAFDKEMSELGCQYLAMFSFSSPTFREPFYPYRRLEGKFDILQTTHLDDDNRAPAVVIIGRLRSTDKQSTYRAKG